VPLATTRALEAQLARAQGALHAAQATEQLRWAHLARMHLHALLARLVMLAALAMAPAVAPSAKQGNTTQATAKQRAFSAAAGRLAMQ